MRNRYFLDVQKEDPTGALNEDGVDAVTLDAPRAHAYTLARVSLYLTAKFWYRDHVGSLNTPYAVSCQVRVTEFLSNESPTCVTQ